MLLLKAIPRYGKRISLRAEQLTYAIGSSPCSPS